MDNPGNFYEWSGARYNHYADKSARLNSFADWPRDRGQRPEELANAGFFYTGLIPGNEDCTRCFYCGGSLRNWLPGDQPFVEHARWFADCQYIRSVKDDEFVDNVHVNFPRHFQRTSDAQVDECRSREPTPPADYEHMVRSVMLKPCGMALDVLGFPRSLIRYAVIKALSENDWNESQITRDLLVRACLDLQEAKKNGPTNAKKSSGGTECVPFLTDDALSKISKENDQMKDRLKCKLCQDKEMAIVFLPCGHLVLCMDCHSLATITHCLICRSEIITYVRARLSN